MGFMKKLKAKIFLMKSKESLDLPSKT